MSQAWLGSVGGIAVSLTEEIVVLVTLTGVVECYGIVLKSGKKIEVDSIETFRCNNQAEPLTFHTYSVYTNVWKNTHAHTYAVILK